MKIWLDDRRPAPDGFIWVKDLKSFLPLIDTCDVKEVSLDYDLDAMSFGENKDGFLAACHLYSLTRRGKLGLIKWTVHSDHPHAYKITQVMERIDIFWSNENEDLA